ncbi:hypothetical protein [Candidatus Pelagibacter sp.]|uniref:hypothetical protein n=1 Tax=Candidatus Pelagibacter sp. TaxID=2024849 RepID=UPI003F857F19
MKTRFMTIVAILIFIKVIGLAVRANANNYLPGYTCDSSTTFQINCGESYYEINKINSTKLVCSRDYQFNFIVDYSNPTYRCGQTPKFKWI